MSDKSESHFGVVEGNAEHSKRYQNMHFHVHAPDADGYSELDTRELPMGITAYELAMILNMTIRAPNYVIRRDFAPVAHLFTPCDDFPADRTGEAG